MLVSAHCSRTTPNTSQKGCIPLPYIICPTIFVFLIILVVGLLAYRQHLKDKRAPKEHKEHDLEAWNCTPKPGLMRAKTDSSLPPSYHNTEESLETTIAKPAIIPQPRTSSPIKRPCKAQKPARVHSTVNFSRRSLRERRFSSKATSVSPLRIVTPPPPKKIAKQHALQPPWRGSVEIGVGHRCP